MYYNIVIKKVNTKLNTMMQFKDWYIVEADRGSGYFFPRQIMGTLTPPQQISLRRWITTSKPSAEEIRSRLANALKSHPAITRHINTLSDTAIKRFVRNNLFASDKLMAAPETGYDVGQDYEPLQKGHIPAGEPEKQQEPPLEQRLAHIMWQDNYDGGGTTYVEKVLRAITDVYPEGKREPVKLLKKIAGTFKVNQGEDTFDYRPLNPSIIDMAVRKVDQEYRREASNRPNQELHGWLKPDEFVQLVKTLMTTNMLGIESWFRRSHQVPRGEESPLRITDQIIRKITQANSPPDTYGFKPEWVSHKRTMWAKKAVERL